MVLDAILLFAFFTVSWPSYFVYLSKQKCRSEGNTFEIVSVKPVPSAFKMILPQVLTQIFFFFYSLVILSGLRS